MGQSISCHREFKVDGLRFEIKRVRDWDAQKTFYVLFNIEYVIDQYGISHIFPVGNGVVCDKNITDEEAYKLWLKA